MNYYTSFIIRWLLLLLPIQIFSFILTPLTIYGSFFLLYLYKPLLEGNILVINNFRFELIEACIATYAYYFFYALVLTTKDIKLNIRLKILGIGFLLIFLMNIFRIALVIFLAVEFGFYWFNVVHLIFWKFISGIYVALVWIILVKYYKIDSIPVYDDLKTLYKKAFKR
ncbi:MAG TPA: pacearchaeosortase [Candidatus Nanoarchaeia archaeon]|nr:pacearchaeosortase [Candidatus Nanoarchaeia archaeon]